MAQQACDSCSPGAVILVPLESLRPTQMTVGMRAVTRKRRKLEGRVSRGKRVERILKGRPIPVVRGPGGDLFVVDHHHFGLALWQAEIKTAYAEIIDDISGVSRSAFWRRMEAGGRLHPYDEDGQRIAPWRLPTWLHALRHDAFRDLAWEVREAGGFRKVLVPYAEFRWANFFRERIPLSVIREDRELAMSDALRLCRAREARNLPGYISAGA